MHLCELLGPILFLLYINDVPSIFSSKIHIDLFADDTKLYFSYASESERFLLQNNLNLFSQWANKWQLNISLSKCAVMTLGKVTPSKYFINNIQLENVTFYKYLGIIFENNILFNKNIISIIWSPFSKVSKFRSLIDQIERVQRLFTRRLITRCVGYTNSSNINYKTYIERLVYFKLESLELRRLKIDLTTIFKISNNYTDINISDILNISNNCRTRGNCKKLNVIHNSDNTIKNIINNNDDLIIKQSSYILFLGIFIDENLNWKKQIHNIKNKLNRCISLINRLKSKFNRESLMNIYYSLFHSHLHYCSILWGNTYFSNIKCITILQNRCLRSIYYLHNRTNIDHIYIHKRILKFNDIIDLNIYKYMYKAWYNNNIHPQIIKLFNKKKTIYSLRSTNEFVVPNISRCYDKFCIGYKGPLLWNSLSIDIKTTNPLKKFLNVLKQQIIGHY